MTSPIAPIGPGVSPFETIQIASQDYQRAQAALTIEPNVRKDPSAMVLEASKSAKHAVMILEPLAKGGDMFSQRNATASIGSARDGIALLQQAATALTSNGSASPDGPDVAQLMEQAKSRFSQADSALWWESAPGA